MKKYVKNFVSLAIAAGFLVSGISAYSEPGEGFRERGKRWGKEMSQEEREVRREKIHKFLGLTPEQEAQLKTHREAHQARREELRASLKETREALRAELGKTDLDTAKINSLKNDLKEFEAQKVENLVSGILEVREILTSEQFAKFQEFGRKHREKRKGKFRKKRDLPQETE